MPSLFTIQTIDGEIEFPVEHISKSGVLKEMAEVAWDVDTSEDEDTWVQELLDADSLEPISLLFLTVREMQLYLIWVQGSTAISGSSKLPEYLEQWKGQMRLQKPHIDDPTPDSKLPQRLEDSWTVKSLLDDDDLAHLDQLFHWDYNDICESAVNSDIPPESPFLHTPDWVLPLTELGIPEEFPRDLLWYWLKEWHFIDLNGLEIPDELTLNAFLRWERQRNVLIENREVLAAQGKTEEEIDAELGPLHEFQQQQEVYDPEEPIIIDWLCQNLDRITMPELASLEPDFTISDLEERAADLELRRQAQFAAAENRIRSEIFIPTAFPKELTEQWLLRRLDIPTVYNNDGVVEETTPDCVQVYHENEMVHLRSTPHTTPADPLWGLGAVIGELALLGKEKLMDPWLAAAAEWRLSELTDLMKSPEQHMRLMKYYNVPRNRQFLSESFYYGD